MNKTELYPKDMVEAYHRTVREHERALRRMPGYVEGLAKGWRVPSARGRGGTP